MRGIADAGVPLYVGHGNRDFLLGERFAQATGATLLPDFVVVDLHGTRTLLCHGDELCTDDVEYQAYRARMRDPADAGAAAAPALLRAALIAWWLRRKSRNDKALKPESIMDVAADAVEAAFRAHDARAHDPRPHASTRAARTLVDGALRERFVLADWHDRGSYFAVDAAGVHVREIASG